MAVFFSCKLHVCNAVTSVGIHNLQTVFRRVDLLRASVATLTPPCTIRYLGYHLSTDTVESGIRRLTTSSVSSVGLDLGYLFHLKRLTQHDYLEKPMIYDIPTCSRQPILGRCERLVIKQAD